MSTGNITKGAVTATSSATFTNKDLTDSTNKRRDEFGFVMESPTSSESIIIYNTNRAITITSVVVSIVGSTPSVTWNLAHSTNPSSLSNDVFTADNTTTTTSAVNTYSSGFSDATVPASSAIAFTSSAQSGTVTYISLTVYFTED